MSTLNTLTRGAAALALLIALPACSSGEPDDGGAGDEELITQVEVTLTNASDASDSVTITGTASGGEVIDSFSPSRLTLRSGATYNGSIRLLDTINDVNITDEIEDEAEEHLFRYSFQPTSAGTVTLTDNEDDYTTARENGGNFQVGLEFRAVVNAGASGNGTMNVLLYHFGDEGSPKTSSTATSDEIDVDIAFPVRFQ